MALREAQLLSVQRVECIYEGSTLSVTLTRGVICGDDRSSEHTAARICLMLLTRRIAKPTFANERRTR
jgi:hypothetical protein